MVLQQAFEFLALLVGKQQLDARLAPQVHVARRADGYCWTGAFPFIDDRYAWRCMTGNFIQTPCFSPMTAHPSEVVCADSPWDSSHVLLIRLTKPLPWAEANTGGDWTGWALQLSNKATPTPRPCRAARRSTSALAMRGQTS